MMSVFFKKPRNLLLHLMVLLASLSLHAEGTALTDVYGQAMAPICPSGQSWVGPLTGGGGHCEGASVSSCTAKCHSMSESGISECLRRCNSNAADETSQRAATTSASPEQMAQQCISQAQGAISSCTAASDSANSTCDSNSNSSLTGAASQAALALGQATGSSVQAACSNMGGVSQGANAGLAAYRSQCSGGKQACTNACGQARSALENCANQSADPSAVKSAMQGMGEYQQVTSNNSSCAALQTKIEEANQAISNYANTAANSQDCASATSGMDPSMDASQAGDPNSAYCQAHPTVASCVVDCSKASMASNPTCSYLKNPYAGSGSSLEKSSGLTASGGGYAAPTAAASGADLKLGGDPAWMGTPDLADRIAQARSGASEAIGGKTGNSANVGAGGGGTGGAPAHKGGPVLDDGPNGAGAGSGFYGSGGGGGSGGGSAYAAAAAARDRYVAANGGNPRGANAPDLRQFLPGGAMDPRRRIAGADGADGITGPNSNIWQKVQNRYRVMSPSLLP